MQASSRRHPPLHALIALILLVTPGGANADLVSRWTFDATPADSAGPAPPNNGTIVGQRVPLYVQGHDGTARGALDLDGADDYVQISQRRGLPIFASPRGYSVALWVNAPAQRSRSAFAEASTSDADPLFSIGPDSTAASGKVEVFLRTNQGTAVINRFLSRAAAFDDAWHHITWVDEGGRGSIYIDGALDSTLSYTVPAREFLALNTTVIGAALGASACCHLQGSVDDVQVFDHPLSAAEVRALAPPRCPSAVLSTVVPATVSSEGGTEVTFNGIGFEEGSLAHIGGRPLTNQVLTVIPGAGPPQTRIRGLSPALAAGQHPADVRCPGGEIAARWTGLVTSEAPSRPEVRVAPPSLDFERVAVASSKDLTLEIQSVGSAALVIEAVELLPALGDFSLPGASLAGRRLAPPAGATPGETALLAVRYVPSGIGQDRASVRIRTNAASQPSIDVPLLGLGVAPPSPPPEPQEIEASLAEGTARFSWFNPIPYQSIIVEDANGNFLRALPGDATSLDLAASGRERVDIRLKGSLSPQITSKAALGLAIRHNCVRPPPLGGSGIRGPLEFNVYGGPKPEFAPLKNSCPGGGGGGGLPGFDIAQVPPLNGVLQKKGALGYVVADSIKTALPNFILDYRNKLTTGFILEKPATKLEIAAYYEKILTANDLDLRGRLTLVHPFDPQVESQLIGEFTFPDIIASPPRCDDVGGQGAGLISVNFAELLLGRGKQWNCALYFRADGDPVDSTSPQCLDPDGPPGACPGGQSPLALPAGEYLLDIYAVGGNRKLPYYVFVDDLRDYELLIPGAPCPPYPLVRITDLTGQRTLPVIEDEVEVDISNELFGDISVSAVTFEVSGSWTDESDCKHSIDPDDPDYLANPDFEYTWRFKDLSPQLTRTTSTNSLTLINTIDFGCYYIDITVKDKACGFSKTRTVQAAVIPENIACPAKPYAFLNPVPKPGGIWAVVGLDPPPGQGKFEGKRKVEFRVLVVPRCTLNCPTACGAPFLGDQCTDTDDWIRFRLATGPNENDIVPANIIVEDLCLEIPNGPKFFHVTIEDLGEIVSVPAAPGEYADLFFQGRAVRKSDNTPATGADAMWLNIGDPLHLFNAPASLTDTFWSGHFEPADDSYHFIVKSSQDTEQRFSPGMSESIDILGVAEIPEKDNDMGSGFTSRFQMHKGIWMPETGTGTSSGEVMSNSVDTAPLQVAGGSSNGGGGGEGGGAGLGDVLYDWCTNEKILENEFEETIFEAVLYSGFIGPIPVTIWASIGLGLKYAIEAQASVFVRPFAALQGQPVLENHFYLLSCVGITIPAEIRADILGGIGYVSVGLEPQVTFELDAHVQTLDLDIVPRLFVQALFSMYMEVKGCIDLLLFEICASVRFPIVENVELLPTVGCCPKPLITCDNMIGGDFPTCQPNNASRCPSAACLPGGGGGGAGEAGAGAGIAPLGAILQVTSAPTLASHPDGTLIGSWVDENGFGHVYVDDVNDPLVGGEAFFGQFGAFRDPAAAFIAGMPNQAATTALVAWTHQFVEESGIDWPPDPGTTLTLAQRNQLSATQEIYVSRIHFEEGFGWTFGTPGFRLSDATGDPGPKTADGRAAMAGDLLNGEAMIAWVRYETPDFLIPDGTTTVRRKVSELGPGEVCAGLINKGWCSVQLPNIRPQLEKTAIYARRASAAGPIGPRMKVSPPGDGVNIEPAIALSPSSAVAYCVWVHAPGQEDLVQSNIGRNLQISIYTRATDSWSSPQPVWPESFVDPADYPAMLQPSIALKANDKGVLAFTALEPGRPVRDTGLAGGRFVYISRLEGGVFGEPILVHGKCRDRQYGEWSIIYTDLPDLVDQRPWKLRLPDILNVYTGSGTPGLEESAGHVMATVLAHGSNEVLPPVNLTPDGNRHMNIASSFGNGSIRSLHLNGGPAQFNPLRGGGGGNGITGFEFQSTRLEPDLAVAACELSHAFPAPGSFVTAKVTVENLGLASSALDASEQSAVGLKAVYIEEDGRERVVARQPLPEIPPAGNVTVELRLEMPHDPVRLRVDLDPNPIDRDLSNNWRECFFGAPCPREIECTVLDRQAGGGMPAALLTWTNTALYDEVMIYKDGAPLTTVPGRFTSFVDPSYSGGNACYEIRGVMGPSKSIRGMCCLDGTMRAQFRRGDVNADGTINITDPVFTLGYLFTGGRTPICLAAADTDDGGSVNITDGIYALSFLFLGGPPPRPPHPGCGQDPTPDMECAQAHDCR